MNSYLTNIHPDQKQIYQAIAERDLVKINSLIAQGINLNRFDFESNNKPFKEDEFDFTSKKIEADGTETIFYVCQLETEMTPLKQAIINGSIEIVGLLLEAGASPNRLTNLEENSPIGLAVQQGDLEVVKLLIGFSANLDYGFDAHPIFMAICHNHIPIIYELVRAGADVNGGSSSGQTNLMFAARKGLLEIVQLLVEAGANVDKVVRGKTALCVAAENGQCEVFEYLYPLTTRLEYRDHVRDILLPQGIRRRQNMDSSIQ